MMPANKLFTINKPLIGMIHVNALPGTPQARYDIKTITKTAVEEANIYSQSGFDGLLIENMHDLPYLRGAVGPEITASMAIIAHEIRRKHKLPIGLQILAGANKEALAVAYAADLDYIRAEGYSFAHVADEGIIESCAGELLRYRRHIGAERIQIWTDVKKKHAAHAITADVSLGEMAAAVEFMLAEAVIITGTSTGASPEPQDVMEAKQHCKLPVIIGSGMATNNLHRYYSDADGFIIGSSCKVDGKWHNALDPKRVEGLVEEIDNLRNSIGVKRVNQE